MLTNDVFSGDLHSESVNRPGYVAPLRVALSPLLGDFSKNLNIDGVECVVIRTASHGRLITKGLSLAREGGLACMNLLPLRTNLDLI